MGHELGVFKKVLVSWGYTLFHRGKLLLTTRDQHYRGEIRRGKFPWIHRNDNTIYREKYRASEQGFWITPK